MLVNLTPIPGAKRISMNQKRKKESRGESAHVDADGQYRIPIPARDDVIAALEAAGSPLLEALLAIDEAHDPHPTGQSRGAFWVFDVSDPVAPVQVAQIETADAALDQFAQVNANHAARLDELTAGGIAPWLRVRVASRRAARARDA